MTTKKEITSAIAPLWLQTVTRQPVKKLFTILLGSLVLVFSACEEEPQITLVVDSPAREYIDRFVDEAALRGFDVAYATSQVDVRLGDIAEPNVIGQCSWTQSHDHSITLDRYYWQGANDMQREFLVFHELGHCVLGRNHLDEQDANGNCISIMSSGTGGCRVFYHSNNRERMLDELFLN